MKNPGRIEIAVYGKGGIGKSTVSANLSATLAAQGRKVLQIGCDPKHDSTRLLMHGETIVTILEYLKEVGKDAADPSHVLHTGFGGVGCLEAGGPRPGVGCAGRGIISAFEFLERHNVKEQYDTVLYDVLGDVVCGGFAVPVRREYADAIFLVTSGEYMALYAANNILRGVYNYDGETGKRVAGIIYNERKLADEDARVERFAEAVGLPVLVKIPRSDAFAKAETAHVTLAEMEGFENEKAVFARLASGVRADMQLYPARPLSDEALEAAVLRTRIRTEAPGAAGEEGNRIQKTARGAAGEEDDWTQPGAPGTAGSAGAEDSQSNAAGAEGSQCNAAGAEISQSKTAGEESGQSYTAAKNRLPLYGCAFNGAATCAIHLTDALVIAHSPRACAFYTWQNISSPGRRNLFNRGILMPSAISPNFECTDMSQTEAVFGGTEKLKEAVAKAIERKPGAVIVISSCTSGIIGDDLAAAESLSTPEIPVIAIPADGDIAGDYMEGIRMAMHTLGERLIDRSVRPSGKCVNFINETGVSNNHTVNYRIMESMLSKMGISVNCRFLGDASADEMRNFLKAPLNILAADSADGRELESWLTEEYGCRFASSPFPVGEKNTRRFLEEIGAFFGCADLVPDILRGEEEHYRSRIEELKPQLAGRRVLLSTINTNMDFLLQVLDDLGMVIVRIGVLNYLRQEVKVSDTPEKYPIVEDLDWERLYDDVSDLHPDFVISNYTPPLADGDYVRDVVPMMPVIGFSSGIDIVKRWADLLKRKREGGWMHDRKYYDAWCR